MLTAMILLALQAAQQDEAVPYSGEARVRVWHSFSSKRILDRDEITGWSLLAPEVLNLAANQALDDSEEQDWLERSLRFVLVAGPLWMANDTISAASHEFGHFRAFSQAGLHHFWFLNENDPSDHLRGTPWTAAKTQFGSNYLHKDLYVATAADPEQRFPNHPQYQRLAAVMEAGGLNQQQYNAEVQSARVLDGEVHLLEGFSYLANLFGTLVYKDGVGGDISDYLNDLEALGVRSDKRTIKLWSQLPKLAGNGSLSFASALVSFFATGDKVVRPLKTEFGGVAVYWPDFASYLTLDGPTIKAMQRLGWQEQALTISWEQSLSDRRREAGLNWQGRILDCIFGEAKFIHDLDGGHYWVEGGPVFRICDWLSLGCQYYHGNGRTLHREIVGLEPDFLKDRESGVKGFLELCVRF